MTVWQCQLWQCYGVQFGSANFGGATDLAVNMDASLAGPSLVVPWIRQCHGLEFGSVKFGSALHLAVPQKFGSASFRHGFGTASAVPRMAVWQCQFRQCHRFGSATNGSSAVPNLAVLRFWQCR